MEAPTNYIETNEKPAAPDNTYPNGDCAAAGCNPGCEAPEPDTASSTESEAVPAVSIPKTSSLDIVKTGTYGARTFSPVFQRDSLRWTRRLEAESEACACLAG